ncbi:MAG: chitobiase/beta-hexosaminidase C-terminal domain-containing protein [Eubacteriales bacterium]
MKCTQCGATLQDDSIRCNYCGNVLQMVPDYNPLEEVIEEEVRSAIYTDSLQPTPTTDQRRPQRHTTSITRNLTSEIEQEHERERTRNTNRELAQRERKEQEQRRQREQERRRTLKKKRRNVLIGCITGVVILLVTIIYLIYSNSYNGIIGKAENSYNDNNMNESITYYERAISKDSSKIEAYAGLSRIYIQLDQLESAEEILLEGATINPSDLDMQQSVIDFYILTSQLLKITDFLSTLDDNTIMSALEDYESTTPEFSLSEGFYEDVQELTISSEETYVYYTTDGSEASSTSTLYTDPIQIGEGTTTIRAISVNAEGIPSYEYISEYTIEIPMVSAPVVTPSTGQYTEQKQITVVVPTGYTAYYTLDNTTPTVNSYVYTNPVDMPEGNTIFTVVLMNSSGKYSDATKRNYDLVLEEEQVESTPFDVLN